MDYSKHIPRIVTGTQIFKIKNNLYYSRQPTLEKVQKCHLLAQDFYNEKKYEGVPNKERLLSFCIEKGILDKDYEDQLKNLNKIIDNAKIMIFKNFFSQEKAVKNGRSRIESARKQQLQIHNLVSGILDNSIEGLHQNYFQRLMFRESIFDENKDLIREGTTAFYNSAAAAIHKDRMDDKELRSFVLSNDWRSIWNSLKHRSFKNNLGNLTSEQSNVLFFSRLYDFAFQCPHPPHEKIVEDADAFDGWYLSETRRISEERKRAQGATGLDDKYQEVFKVVDSQEKANEVYNLNDDNSKRFLRERAQVLKKGKARDIEFRDNKNDILQATNEARKAKR